MKRLFCFFSLFIFTLVCFSQDKIKELEEKLSVAKDKDKGDIFNDIGKEYCFKGDFDNAKNYFFQALRNHEESNNKKGIAKTLNNIGVIYLYQSDYKSALEYYSKSLRIDEDNDNFEGMAHTLSNMGLIHFYLDNMGKALQYYQQSYELYSKIGFENDKANALYNIGQTYYQSDQLEDAVSKYMQAIEIYNKVNDKKGIANVSYYLGLVYCEEDDYEKAKEYFDKALIASDESANLSLKAQILTAYAKLLNKKKDIKGAIVQIEQSIKICSENDLQNLQVNNYRLCSEYYEALGDFQKALEFYKLYTDKKNEVNEEENLMHIFELQKKFEVEKKEKDIEILKKDKEIYELKFQIESLKK